MFFPPSCEGGYDSERPLAPPSCEGGYALRGSEFVPNSCAYESVAVSTGGAVDKVTVDHP